MIGDDILREQFAAESEEHLDAIERLLGTGGARDRAAVDTLFRAFHSLKGMSGALDAGGMLAVAHHCEDILGLARQGRIVVAGEVADALIAAVDAMRRQRAALVGADTDLPAPAALLARLGALAEATPAPGTASAPVPAAAPAAPPAPPPVVRHYGVLAEVAAKVAQDLAPLAAGPSAPAVTLVGELAELARAAGGLRLGRMLDALRGCTGAAALPILGDIVRALDALREVGGQEAGAAALSRAVAAVAGDGGLPARFRALAVMFAAEAQVEACAEAQEAGRIAAAIGATEAEALLLTIEDLLDRRTEPDAAAVLSAQRDDLLARLRAAGGGATPSAAALEPAMPAGGGLPLPEDFAAALGAEGTRRAADALAAGRGLYRARLGALGTIASETALLQWLGDQGAEALASRVVPGTTPPTLELLLAAPADARALEASRAAFDPAGAVVAALVPLGLALPEEAAPAPTAATLRIRHEVIDGIIALEAEVRAAGLSLAEASAQGDARALASSIAGLSRDLPPSRAAEAGLLAERVRVVLQEVRETGDRLSIALRRLDEAMMELRVTPLSGLFARMPRVARAVAQLLGKEVEVVLEGGDVSIDRGLIELLADPLQHLVRNAVDHGVEPPLLRAAAGKPQRARLVLAAERHGADRVRITVADDGAGIDSEMVRRTAVARGVASEAAVARLDAEAVHALLFLPGFSTRREVSATSGRGVGLDVVEEAVHRAGGTVAIESRRGEGTRFILDLPLSAALAPVLLVEAGGHSYALPVARVEAVLNADDTAGAAALPSIVSLEAALGLPVPREPGGIVVLRGPGGRPLGLAVGKVSRRVDLLLRPLHPSLAALPGVGGVGVLGTGQPVVVLEPDGLVPG